MRIFYSSIVFFLSFLLLSCSEIQFPEFKVESCDFSDNKVNISFSNIPNQYTFIKAFTLKEESQEIEGVFSFEQNNVIFTPNNGIKNEYLYELVISTDAEDIKGNSLTHKYEKTYTTRTDFERPLVKSITPQNETNNQTQVNKITIEFNKTIDVNSLKNALSLSPSFNYILKAENNDSKITIMPLEPLKRRERYSIKISTKLSDTHHNFLLNPFESTFINYNDYKKPEYKLLLVNETENVELFTTKLNSNILKNDTFLLEFSEEMDINYLSSYIEVFPELSLTVKPNKNTKNKAEISFSDDIVWGVEYQLKILKGLKDLCNNEIDEEKVYRICFNNEKNRPVELKKVLIDLKNSTENYNEITNYSTMTFNVETFPPNNEIISTNLYLIFSISKDAESLSELSLMNSISFEYTNSCFNSFMIKSLKNMTEDEIDSELPVKTIYDTFDLINENICIAKINVEIENSSNTNIGVLILSLSKNIKDSLGNVLEKDYKFYINKQ